ncbi:hypothetical protein BZG36_04554 [Bifiguratus adelaidae]|uniref:Vacuolar import and degradation protein 21 n=1 Tax=Bifiguratus adelaidae TaxID=1938954 RepID=A0A261XX88_9FUNG|nr:hypothetical protein BZG36_04554 [Bifiguratus adelaidae]
MSQHVSSIDSKESDWRNTTTKVISDGPKSLRDMAESTRQKELKSIVEHRDGLLTELFVLEQAKQQDDGVLNAALVSDAVDEKQLRNYLEQNKLNTWSSSNDSLRKRPEPIITNGGALTSTSHQFHTQTTDTQNNNAQANSPVDSDESSQQGLSSEFSPTRRLKRTLPPPERMVTRGVSGAIRHKSVDEILSAADNHTLGIQAGQKPDKATQGPTTPGAGVERHRDELGRPSKRQLDRVAITMKRQDSRQGYFSPTSKFASLQKPSGRPMDLFSWQFKVSRQPLFKTLQTANKVLSTSDWKIARDELKSLRMLQRVDGLRTNNTWSFRQLKRHRPGPRKRTHWDHLLSEMKWMQTDFKEERRWKMANAFILAHAVLDWHCTDDKQALCVQRRIPEPLSERMEEDSTLPTDEPLTAANIGAEGGQATIVTLDANIKEEDAIKQDVMLTSSPKVGDQSIADQGQTTTEDGAQLEIKDEGNVDASKGSLNITATALATQSPQKDATSELATTYQHYRPAILETDVTSSIFLLFDLGEYSHSVVVQSLFPDLPLYEPPNPETDDPFVDEYEQAKIIAISKFMAKKGVLRPEPSLPRKRRRDETDETEDYFEAERAQEKTRVRLLAGMSRYDNAPLISPIFAPKKLRDVAGPTITQLQPPSGSSKHASTWTDEDDSLLLSLTRQFQYNWDLINETLNSVRGPITGERWRPYDCYMRWKEKEPPTNMASGPVLTGWRTDGLPVTSPAGAIQPASSTSANANKKKDLLRKSGSKPESMRKKQRTYAIFEAIKRTQKKRESQKPTASQPIPEEKSKTHGYSYNGARLPSPLEMSQAKFDRDRRIAQAYIEQRSNMMQANQAAQLGTVRPPHQLPGAAGFPQQRPVQNVVRPGTAVSPTPGRPVIGQPANVGVATSPSQATASAAMTNGRLPQGAVPGNSAARMTPEQIQSFMIRQQQQMQLLQAANGGRPPASNAGMPRLPQNIVGPSSGAQTGVTAAVSAPGTQPQQQTAQQAGNATAQSLNVLNTIAQQNPQLAAQLASQFANNPAAAQVTLQRYIQQIQLRASQGQLQTQSQSVAASAQAQAMQMQMLLAKQRRQAAQNQGNAGASPVQSHAGVARPPQTSAAASPVVNNASPHLGNRSQQ